MMQTLSLHSPKQMPQLGLTAYWCLFAKVSNDRTPEIRRVQGDTV
jgi:hypothetical protein